MHNATQGQELQVTFGRTDFEYSFGLPFDAFVTNAWSDLSKLFEYWDRHPQHWGNYLLFSPPVWSANSFYLTAPKQSPLVSGLESACECRPIVLTRESKDAVLASIKPVAEEQ